jgi:hypothetical protein
MILVILNYIPISLKTYPCALKRSLSLTLKDCFTATSVVVILLKSKITR